MKYISIVDVCVL